MAYVSLPAYNGNALVDFKPVSDAIDSYRTNALRDAQLKMEQERLGMQRQQFDMTMQDKEAQRAGWEALRSDPNFGQGLPQGYRNILASGALMPEQAASNAAQYYQKLPEIQDAREKNALMRSQLAEQVAQNARMHPLEQQRLQLQVQEADQKANDPIRQLIRETMRGGQQPAPPQGGLQPQSFQGGIPQGDPNLIRTQAAPGMPPQGAAPQQQPQEEMVDIGLGKPIPARTAKLMALDAYQKGNHQFGKYIEDQMSSQMEKGAKTELDKSRTNYTQSLGRLTEINRTFDPAYLKAGTQLEQWFNNAKEKAGATLTPQQQAEAQGFHQFRTQAISHFNMALKEMSGTAVSEQEFRRIVAQMPNPGTGMLNGVLDGDGPTQFKAKLNAGVRSMQLAAARANFLAAKGFKGDINAAASAMPLDQMPDVIQRRTQQLQQGFQQQGATPDQLPGLVQQQLKKEFGI